MLKPKDYGRLLLQSFAPNQTPRLGMPAKKLHFCRFGSHSSHNWRWRRFNCALASLSFHRLPHTLQDQCFVNCPVTSLSSYALQM